MATWSIPARAGREASAIREMLRGFGPRAWVFALGATLVALLAIGIPTRLIANDWFIRMTPTRTQDYVLWIISAPLIGLIAGSYMLNNQFSDEYKVTSGGVLSYLAVGCPVCNKIVVFALGVSGAMTYFAPAQLLIGMASVALLLWTLSLRARSIAASCAMRAPRIEAPPPHGLAYVFESEPEHEEDSR